MDALDRMVLPFPQGRARSACRPHAVNPGSVSANNKQHEAVLLLVVLNLCVETRHALECTEVYVDLEVVGCGGGGGETGVRNATSADCYR